MKAEQVKEIALGFHLYMKDHAWQWDFVESKTHTPEEHYYYFIKNIWK